MRAFFDVWWKVIFLFAAGNSVPALAVILLLARTMVEQGFACDRIKFSGGLLARGKRQFLRGTRADTRTPSISMIAVLGRELINRDW